MNRKWFFINFLKKYFGSFKLNLSKSALKGFDLNNLTVHIFIRGSRSITDFQLEKIIFEQGILSTLNPYEAALIGYYYGMNYKKMTKKNYIKNSSFFLKNDDSYKNAIISIDRNNCVGFTTNISNRPKQIYMQPMHILSQKKIINDFHPVQACFIGISAGIKQVTNHLN